VQREADKISGIAQNREAIMRTITVAAAMILLLTAHANSQNLNMLGGLGDKRPLSAEEAAIRGRGGEAKGCRRSLQSGGRKNTQPKIHRSVGNCA